MFPAGFFGFTATGVGVSTTAVDLFFQEGTIILRYWKYGATTSISTPHWYEFDFDGATGIFIDVNKVTLHFVDGQRGDDDLTANGQIVDVGGPVFAPADLILTKSDLPDPVLVGERLTYTLVITNQGPSSATDVTLTDTLTETLPPNATFISAEPSQGSCAEELMTVTCNLGDLSNLADATVTITVVPEEAAGGTIIPNLARVEANESDSDNTNNSAIQRTVVNRHADTALIKTADPDPVLVEKPLTYTLVVANHGPSQATMVEVIDELPVAVTFESVRTSQGSCNHAGGSVTCDLGKLDNGATATIAIIVTPTAAAGGITLTNKATVTVTSDVADFNLENNDVIQNTAVLRSVDLGVGIADTPDPVQAGDRVIYEVTVTNNGPSLATGVVLTGSLPAKTIFESATPNQGHCEEETGTLTCVLGALVKEAKAKVTIAVIPMDRASGTDISISASVNAAEIDPESANNTASQDTTVRPAADLSVTRAGPAEPVLLGGGFSYTLTVINQGPSKASGVTLTDSLSTSATFVSALPSQGSCSGTLTVACDIGTLESGNDATVTITVVPNISGDLTNTTRVEATEGDPDVRDNISIGITLVAAAADIQLSQVEGPGLIVVGNKLSYTLTVRNAGPSDASGVTFINTLADGVSFDSATPDTYGCVALSSTVRCSLGSLASGESATFTIVVNTKRVGRIVSTARVTADGMDAAEGEETTLDLSHFRFPTAVALLQQLGSSPIPTLRPAPIPTPRPTMTPTPVPPTVQPTPTPTTAPIGGEGSGNLIRFIVILGVATGIVGFLFWRRRRNSR